MPDSKDFNAVLYEKLYSKLAIALGVGSREGAFTIGESLLSIYNPGQYLPVGLDPIGKAEDDQEISLILDTAPMFNFTYSSVLLQVSQAYENILRSKVFPVADLSAAEKAKLENARRSYAELEDPCNNAMYNYMDASDVVDTAIASQKNGTGPGPTSRQKAEAKAAMDKWIAVGKYQQQTNVAIIAQYEGRDGANFWKGLDEKFGDNQRDVSGLRFPPVVPSPRYASWFKDAGWTKFEFSQKDMDNQTNSSALGVAGSLDATFGIFKISGSGDYSKDQKYIKIDQTELSFSCELMRVTLTRPWMNPLVFNSRAWKFSADSGTGQYSSGGSIKDDIIPVGPFVAIPTTVILARNVKIIGKFQDTVEETIKTAINGEASLGIGPFSITGRVSYHDETHKIRGSIAGNTIEIKDTQIIAAISQVLPQLPNPDNNLPWPDRP